MGKQERAFITPKEAIKLLDDTEYIHTFRNAGFTLLGAEHERKKLIDDIKKADALEIGGSACCKMNHGLVLWRKEESPLFIECKKGTDYSKIKPIKKWDERKLADKSIKRI